MHVVPPFQHARAVCISASLSLQPGVWPRQVRDAAFLFRYNEPVLLLLHEAGLDWAGRARRGGKDGAQPLIATQLTQYATTSYSARP